MSKQPIEGVEANTEPTRADRAQQATRMMEEAWAAEAAAREAARLQHQQQRAAGFPEDSEFESVGRGRAGGRSGGAVTGAGLPPAPPPPSEAPAVPARTLAAEAARGSPALREFSSATRELEQARTARDSADQELGRQLSRLGPGLTSEQMTDFSQRYRQQHAAVYQREQAAADRVSGLLQSSGDELRRAASTPEGARTVARGLAALADSPRAPEALEFARNVAAHGGPAAESLLRAPNFARDVLERGLPNVAGTLIARGMELQDVQREVMRLATPFLPAGTAGAQANRLLTEAQSLASGNMDAIRNMTTRWNDSSTGARMLAGAGLVIAANSARASVANGQPMAQQIEAIARAGQSGAELFSNMVRGTLTGARGAQTATALARLAPGIGLVANAASLVHNGSRFMETRNPGFAVAATGDAIATLGSAIGSFPITAVPGAAVNALGQIISNAGDLTANYIAHRRSAEDQMRHLEANGMSRVAAQALVDNPAAAHQLSRQGFSPQQIQELAGARPDLFTRPADLQVLGETARNLGLPPERALTAMRALSTRETSLVTSGLAQARTPEAQRAFLNDLLAVGADRFSPMAQAALRQLLER